MTHPLIYIFSRLMFYVYHHIDVSEEETEPIRQTYNIPSNWQSRWKVLLKQHSRATHMTRRRLLIICDSFAISVLVPSMILSFKEEEVDLFDYLVRMSELLCLKIVAFLVGTACVITSALQQTRDILFSRASLKYLKWFLLSQGMVAVLLGLIEVFRDGNFHMTYTTHHPVWDTIAMRGTVPLLY